MGFKRGSSRNGKAKTVNLEKRIEGLETRMRQDPVVLHFADGSTRAMWGPADFLLDLLPGCGGAALGPERAGQLELIRQSVGSQEPGGGLVIQLLRAIMDPPEEERQ